MKRPQRVTLEGRHVRIVPLNAAAHAHALYQGAHGPNREELWAYMSNGPYASEEDFAEWLARGETSEDPLFFTILDRASEEPMGYCSLLRIDAPNGVIEVGHILYLPVFQRTTGATEAMYLLARYVFEDLGYRRYEWKCNSLNAPSRRAALRYGFTFEGIFRQHMVVKGKNRDTAWFSMLDSEWESRKRTFEEWLDPANFTAGGRQRSPLGRQEDQGA